MTVGELLQRVSSRELTEWMAYCQVDPFGDERADLRAGIVASTIANANRDPKKQRKPFEPQDFMPFLRREVKKPKSARELYQMLRGWAVGAGGRGGQG